MTIYRLNHLKLSYIMADSIKERIIQVRPNLSKSSVNTYNSILKNLYKKVGEGEEVEKVFKDTKKINEFLKNSLPRQRKTILSALVIFVECEKARDEYRKQMMEDIKTSKEESISQKRDESKDWVDWQDVINIFNALRKDTYYLMKAKPEDLSPKEINTIQDFVILALYVLIAPRRSMDYVELKNKDYKEGEDNYIDYLRNKIYFNKYKTSKFYKTQTVELPKELKTILKKWLTINKGEYLLMDTNGNKLNQIKLNQRLNKIFDMKVSVNALRHSYLTHKYGDIPALKDMMATADDMGHSLDQALEYVKK